MDDSSPERKEVAVIDAPPATIRPRNQTPKESLLSPRRVEIQRNIADKMPMYISMGGNASL
jgi:hypothetical protein